MNDNEPDMDEELAELIVGDWFMNRDEAVSGAIIDRLNALGLQPNQPVRL